MKIGPRAIGCAMLLLIASEQAGATAPASIQLHEGKTVKYACEGGRSLVVVYTAASNGQHFASVPVKGETRWFVETFAGSGARYQAGHYSWWEKGPTANLYDEMASTASPAVIANCRAAD